MDFGSSIENRYLCVSWRLSLSFRGHISTVLPDYSWLFKPMSISWHSVCVVGNRVILATLKLGLRDLVGVCRNTFLVYSRTSVGPSARNARTISWFWLFALTLPLRLEHALARYFDLVWLSKILVQISDFLLASLTCFGTLWCCPIALCWAVWGCISWNGCLLQVWWVWVACYSVSMVCCLHGWDEAFVLSCGLSHGSCAWKDGLVRLVAVDIVPNPLWVSILFALEVLTWLSVLHLIRFTVHFL